MYQRILQERELELVEAIANLYRDASQRAKGVRLDLHSSDSGELFVTEHTGGSYLPGDSHIVLLSVDGFDLADYLESVEDKDAIQQNPDAVAEVLEDLIAEWMPHALEVVRGNVDQEEIIRS